MQTLHDDVGSAKGTTDIVIPSCEATDFQFSFHSGIWEKAYMIRELWE